MGDIETIQDGISVRPPDGRFRKFTPPAGYSPELFRQAVSAYDTAYRQHGKLPTVDEVYRIWPKVAKKTYSAIIQTDEFANAVEYRGIRDFDPQAGLSLEQQHALLKLSDPYDRRSISAKLKELGVPVPQFQAWMKQPLFWQLYNEQSITTYQEALPAIRQRLIGNAEAGDMKAIELVFAKTGEYNPAQQQLEDAKTIILKIVESVITNVRDAETRKAIMADVALHAGTIGAIGTGGSRAVGG